ncbi:MAG: glycosyltransferase family 39 protein [Candidatus Nanohaloarchaea archaeon]|nr:glycosyltransferase family 39 protein [Candidatus Nanohaloarchaea archaeon]
MDIEAAAERAEEVVHSKAFLIAVGFFVAAFAARWVFAQHGFWIDEGRALLIAQNFLQGDGFRYGPDKIMWKHGFVFYTLIAFSYLFFGVKAVAGMVTTNVLAALTVVFVFLTGRELFNDWAGAAAGALMLFVPIHVFYSTRVLTDVPGTFFVVLTLYFWARTENRGERWSFYATFAAAGLTLLTKLTGVVVLPALFIYYLWKEREQLFLQRKYWLGAATTVGLYSIWEVRNILTVGFIGIVDTFFGNYLADAVGAKANPRSTTFLEGAMFHLSQLPNTLAIPGVLLFLTGIAFAYVYRDDRFAIPAMFLPVAFLVLATKGLNRYFLPFIPMAVIVAGYGVDRLRELAAAYEDRAGRAVYALILVLSAAVMFQSAAGMILPAASGFTGIDEAGKWLQQNAPPDAVIIAGSSNQIRFFSQRQTIHAGSIKNQSELSRVLAEQNVQYVEIDRWESTQPRWLVQTVQQSDVFQPVQGFGPREQPSVMVYRVNRAAG